MKSLLFKIGIVQTLLLSLVVAAEAYTIGYSHLVSLTAIVCACLMVAFCYWLLKPLQALEELAPQFRSTAELNALTEDPFDRIRDAIQRREEQLDLQNIKYAEYQERFESVLSGMDEGVIAIDDVGSILFLNRAARSILSIDLPQVIGKPLIGLVRYEAVQLATREALETHKIIDTTFQTYTRPPRDVRLRVAPMAGDPVAGMTLVFQDVTELMRLESIRRDFVAGASHELKTPLSAIKAIAETLLMGAIHKSPDNMRFVQQIDQQADILSRQVNDLLQLARIESGSDAFRSEPVDVFDVCAEAVSQYQLEAGQKGVELVLSPLQDEQGNPPDDSYFVWADHDALRTIFDNLVSNALRYSHHHGSGKRKAQVKVQVRSTEDHCIIEVIDNGIGIAPEHQARIFERFFRVDTARSREQGGTGLGLAIVKHLAMSFDGQVELVSKLGVGSTFRTIFPRFYPPQ